MPSEDSVFKIMLLSAHNLDCKMIAKKVKYSTDIVRNIIDSTPEIPLQQIMSTNDGDYRQIAEKINYSTEQVRKIILIMQPTVDVVNRDFGAYLKSFGPPACNSISNKSENSSEMVFATKYYLPHIIL